MRVLGSIVHILRLAMLDRGQHLTVSDAVTGQLVGDDHPRNILHFLEQPRNNRLVANAFRRN